MAFGGDVPCKILEVIIFVKISLYPSYFSSGFSQIHLLNSWVCILCLLYTTSSQLHITVKIIVNYAQYIIKVSNQTKLLML